MPFNTDKLIATLAGKAESIIRAGVDELASILVDNITAKSGEPSLPGEYPATQTGELANSVVTDVNRVGGRVHGSVSVNAAHAEYVEKMRPFFKRTVEENRQHIIDVMEDARG